MIWMTSIGQPQLEEPCRIDAHSFPSNATHIGHANPVQIVFTMNGHHEP